MNKILIIDDDRNLCYSLHKVLSAKDYSVTEAESGEEAMEKVNLQKPDLVILDIKLPGMSGLETLKRIKKIEPKLPIIIMTAYGTTDTAIEATKFGAYDYILKPFDVNEMQELVRKGLKTCDLMKPVVICKVDGEKEGCSLIIGNSRKMQQVYKMIGQVAGTDMTVLITGESGVGKELVARAIYNHSSRAMQPFLAMNCAAMSDNLIESELFGYEKGAFTGASHTKIGKFEKCNHGTVFLDEIGNMSPATQSKILRVLQEGEFERVGGTKTIKVDVRIISATNINLDDAIRDGTLREDLYYRLNVFSIDIPPLRKRPEDIPELISHFLRRFNREFAKHLTGISKAAVKKLTEYPWSGNVRELENTIKRVVVTSKGAILDVDDFEVSSLEEPSHTLKTEKFDETLKSFVHKITEYSDAPLIPAIEKIVIQETIKKVDWNQSKAAKILGISRHSLRNKMKKYNLREKKPQDYTY